MTDGRNEETEAASEATAETAPVSDGVTPSPAEVIIQLLKSDDPKERLVAARNLCPCHVRHRDERIWKALYRMMEDEDVEVRKAAWHTLEDGGCPTDPAFEPILKRTLDRETNKTVLGFAHMFAGPYLEKERMAIKVAGRREVKPRGKCDFCGETDVPVVKDTNKQTP